MTIKDYKSLQYFYFSLNFRSSGPADGRADTTAHHPSPQQPHHHLQAEGGATSSKQGASSSARPRYRSSSVNRGTNPITPPPPPPTQQNSPPSVIAAHPKIPPSLEDIPPPIPPHGIRVISPTPTLPLAPLDFPSGPPPPVPPHQSELQQQQQHGNLKHHKRGDSTGQSLTNGHRSAVNSNTNSNGRSEAQQRQQSHQQQQQWSDKRLLPRTPSELEREQRTESFVEGIDHLVDQAALQHAAQVFTYIGLWKENEVAGFVVFSLWLFFYF